MPVKYVTVKGYGDYKHTNMTLEVVAVNALTIATKPNFALGIVPFSAREKKYNRIYWDRKSGRRMHPTHSTPATYYYIVEDK